MLSQFWHICDILGLIFIVANGQLLTNNLTIWSHCWQVYAMHALDYLANLHCCQIVKLTNCRALHNGYYRWFKTFICSSLWDQKQMLQQNFNVYVRWGKNFTNKNNASFCHNFMRSAKPQNKGCSACWASWGSIAIWNSRKIFYA